MDKRDILQNIIDNGGTCVALYRNDKTICQYCPMSKLATRSDGTYLSCWDALGLQYTYGGHTDEIYFKKAVELLSDILMDDILRGKQIAGDT